MNLLFSPDAWEDCLHWQQTDKAIVKRIHLIIKDVIRTPFTGIGKQEPLRHDFAGCWSRRITDEHRLAYRVTDTAVELLQLRYHY